MLVAGFGVVLAAAIVVSLTGGGEPTSGPATPTSTTTSPSPTTSATSTTIAFSSTVTTTVVTAADRVALMPDGLIDDMTDEELAHQLVVTGLTGVDVERRLTGTVGSPCLGGVFVTETNVNWQPPDDPGEARDAIARIDAAAADCSTRPLIVTDAELGSVVRVPVEAPVATGAWTERFLTGDQYNTLLDLQEQVADYATALAGLGIDVNFGAVADVDTDPSHFMARSGRTFGSDPGIVAGLANAVIAGHCAAGVAAALKHFPNQGDTVGDPHAEPSVAVSDLATWRKTGRFPYDTTVAPVVMTGHVFMENDPDRPASMSYAITTGLLRDDLGYDGVVVTDDLAEMRGATDVIADPGGRAVAAVRAGADLVFFVDDRLIPEVTVALTAEMGFDAVFRDQVLTSVRRVLALKAADRFPTDAPLCG